MKVILRILISILLFISCGEALECLLCNGSHCNPEEMDTITCERAFPAKQYMCFLRLAVSTKGKI